MAKTRQVANQEGAMRDCTKAALGRGKTPLQIVSRPPLKDLREDCANGLCRSDKTHFEDCLANGFTVGSRLAINAIPQQSGDFRQSDAAVRGSFD